MPDLSPVFLGDGGPPREFASDYFAMIEVLQPIITRSEATDKHASVGQDWRYRPTRTVPPSIADWPDSRNDPNAIASMSSYRIMRRTGDGGIVIPEEG